MKRHIPKSNKPGNVTSFSSAWHKYAAEFMTGHYLVTGIKLHKRMFYWREIRQYYIRGFSVEAAVERYLNTKIRRAAA